MSYPEINALLGATYNEGMIAWIERHDEDIRREMWGALGLGTPGVAVGTRIRIDYAHPAEVLHISAFPLPGAPENLLLFLRYPSGIAATALAMPGRMADLVARAQADLRHGPAHYRKAPSGADYDDARNPGGSVYFGEVATLAGADTADRASMTRVLKSYLREKGVGNARATTSTVGTQITTSGPSPAFYKLFRTSGVTADLSSVGPREGLPLPIPAEDAPMLERLFGALIEDHPAFGAPATIPEGLRENVSVIADNLQADPRTAGLGEWLALRLRWRPSTIRQDLLDVLKVLPPGGVVRPLVEGILNERGKAARW